MIQAKSYLLQHLKCEKETPKDFLHKYFATIMCINKIKILVIPQVCNSFLRECQIFKYQIMYTSPIMYYTKQLRKPINEIEFNMKEGGNDWEGLENLGRYVMIQL